MKTFQNIKKAFVFGCLIFPFWSCNSNPGDTESDIPVTASLQPAPLELLTMDSVPLVEAKINIEAYNDSTLNILGQNPIRAFTVNAADLLQVLGFSPSDVRKAKSTFARVYIGLDSAKNFKLYFVPVDSRCNDMCIVDSMQHKFVYDLNVPCPKTCGFNSLFYTNFIGCDSCNNSSPCR